MGFPGGFDGKESAYNAGNPGSIPRSGRPPGEGNGYQLQYSWLENPMDRGARRATAHGVAESDMTEQLNNKNKISIQEKRNVVVLRKSTKF